MRGFLSFTCLLLLAIFGGQACDPNQKPLVVLKGTPDIAPSATTDPVTAGSLDPATQQTPDAVASAGKTISATGSKASDSGSGTTASSPSSSPLALLFPQSGQVDVDVLASLVLVAEPSVDLSGVGALEAPFALSRAGVAQGFTVSLLGRFLTLAPAGQMDPDAQYVLSPTHALAQALGNPAFENTVWSFHTKPAWKDARDLSVQLLQPSPGAMGVPPQTEPLLGMLFPLAPSAFSAMINPLRVDVDGVAWNGTWIQDGQLLRFRPSAPFAWGSTVTIRDSEAFAAAMKLPAAHLPWTFQIQSRPAGRFAVASTFPEMGGSDYPRNTSLQISFTKPVKPASISASTVSVADEGGTPVPGALTVNGREVLFAPTELLRFSTRYIVRVGQQIVDIDDEPIESPLQFSFRVVAAPTLDERAVVVETPWQSGDLPLDPVFDVTLGAALNAEEMATAQLGLKAFRLKDSLGVDIPIGIVKLGSRLSVRPESRLAYGRNYTFSTNPLFTASGLPLEQRSWEYRTRLDSMAPLVTGIVPANGSSGIPINTSVLVTFSKPPLPASITASSLILREDGGAEVNAIRVTDGNLVRLLPQAALHPGAHYIVEVSSSVTDASGNPLSGTSVVAFDTAPEASLASVTGTWPASGATGHPVGAEIRIQFSSAMKVSSFSGNISLETATGGAVAANVAASEGGFVAVLTPTGNLSPNSSYRVLVTQGVLDALERPLAAPVTVGFSTGAGADTEPPRVSGTLPLSNDFVLRSAKIAAVFSEPMDTSTLTAANVVLETTAGVTVPTNLAATAYSVTLEPMSPLDANAYYRVRVGVGAKDASGNALPVEYSWVFRTVPDGADGIPPRVTASMPNNLVTDVELIPTLYVMFSERMNAASLQQPGRVTLRTLDEQVVDATMTVENGDTLLKVVPSTTLIPAAQYRLVIQGAVTDASGMAMGIPFELRFETTNTSQCGVWVCGQDPHVAAFVPATGMRYAPVWGRVSFEFDQCMMQSTINDSTVRLCRLNAQGGSCDLAVTGTIIRNNCRGFYFQPSAPLEFNRWYRFSVTTGAKNLEAMPLSAQHSQEFETTQFSTPMSFGNDNSHYNNCLVHGGKPWCWGHYMANVNSQVAAGEPTTTFTRFSSGIWGACGIRADGTLACFGHAPYSQNEIPTGLGTVKEVALHYSTCVIKADNTLQCWGYSPTQAAAVPAGTYQKLVGIHPHGFCALGTDNNVKCWGDNNPDPAAGDADFSTRFVPSAVASGGAARQIYAGYGSVCAVKSDDTLICWGAAGGYRTTIPSTLRVDNTKGNQVTLGSEFGCAIDKNILAPASNIVCWGGTGGTMYSHVLDVPPGLRARELKGGHIHACAIKEDNTDVVCWGSEWNGAGTRNLN